MSVRPWNAAATQDRADGRYYDDGWRQAVAAQPEVVSVTSWNEWHEGTQIEPAVPKARAAAPRSGPPPPRRVLPCSLCATCRAAGDGRAVAGPRQEAAGRKYLDYGARLKPDGYLRKTRAWAMKFKDARVRRRVKPRLDLCRHQRALPFLQPPAPAE